MKQHIKRQTITGTEFTEISFSTICGKYLVKNFTNGNIFVSFDANATENNSAKIPANYFQVVEGNEYLGLDDYKTDKIYIKGSGEVEVQQLCYH